MKNTYNRGAEKAFALPTVMIASIVMLMVLLSGLVASSSVNVALREQVDQKQLSLTTDAGLAMADACLKANEFEITWTDMSPLRPNTNCYGEDISTCLVGTTSAPCYLTVASANNSRSFFDVLAVSGGDGTISSEATMQNLRPSNGTVASENKNTRLGAVGYSLKTNVSAGSQSTCAVSGDRKVYCWGNNVQGQLGNGVKTPNPNPNPVQANIPGGYVSMQSVSNGATHSCAVSMAGRVYCWGLNSSGQLGLGNNADNGYFPTAIAQGQVPTGVKLGSVTNGYYHSCAIGSDKKIYCWGDNAQGQLGIGTTGNSGSTYYSARVVSQGAMPAGVYPTSISSSYNHTCVTGSDVKVYCWGRNNEGQIGNNSTNTTGLNNAPTLVNAGAMGTSVGATSVTTGFYHTCVTGTDGGSYCWGQNTQYQLGINNTTNYLVPVKTLQGAVPANVKLVQISSYNQHTCALGSNSLVYCWGQNSFRQLGQGGTSTATATQPVLASTVTNAPGDEITGLSVGDYHTCINSSNGKIYCWGYNVLGGLGNGNTTSPSDVGQVTSSTAELGVNANTKIAVGSYHTCAIGPDEKVYCTGDDLTANQLGNGGSSTNTNTPTAVAAGAIPVGSRIKSIWAGGYHTCALADNTKVYCWGRNDEGQLGNGSTGLTTVPVEVSQSFMPAGVKIRSMSLGMYYSCAIGSDFRAYCWGDNAQGQLGKGDSANSNRPVAVSQGSIPAGVNFRGVTAGGSHTCAITSDAKMYCWGRNDEGQLGKGNSGSGSGSNVPIAVSQGTIAANTRMRQISTGIDHTCAITSSSKAYCWGANNYGQIGNGSSGTARVTSPTAVSQGNVPAGVGIRSITLGFYHSCAVASNGRPFCWGYNNSYQTGDGPLNVNKLTPTFVTDGTMPSGSKMKMMSTGMYSTCVLNEDSKIYCWGYNNAGGLGNGSSANNSSSPFGMVQSLRWLKNSAVDSTVLQY